jgi:hypothetical protein
MLRWLLLAMLPLSLGCAMCASTEDYTYAAYGGRWQRDDPVTGRVGSAFLPGGSMVISDLGSEQMLKGENRKVTSGNESDETGTESEEDATGSEASDTESGQSASDRQTHTSVLNAPETEESLTDVSSPANLSDGQKVKIRSVLK